MLQGRGANRRTSSRTTHGTTQKYTGELYGTTTKKNTDTVAMLTMTMDENAQPHHLPFCLAQCVLNGFRILI